MVDKKLLYAVPAVLLSLAALAAALMVGGQAEVWSEMAAASPRMTPIVLAQAFYALMQLAPLVLTAVVLGAALRTGTLLRSPGAAAPEVRAERAAKPLHLVSAVSVVFVLALCALVVAEEISNWSHVVTDQTGRDHRPWQLGQALVRLILKTGPTVGLVVLLEVLDGLRWRLLPAADRRPDNYVLGAAAAWLTRS